MTTITAAPGARRLIALSTVARLPLTMVSIGLLLHAQHLTGSFAAAGAVDAAYAIALGLGAPLVGRRRPPRPDRGAAGELRRERRDARCRRGAARRDVAAGADRAGLRDRLRDAAGRRVPARARPRADERPGRRAGVLRGRRDRGRAHLDHRARAGRHPRHGGLHRIRARGGRGGGDGRHRGVRRPPGVARLATRRRLRRALAARVAHPGCGR